MNISDVKIGGLYYLLLPAFEHYYEVVVNFPTKVGNWEAHDTIHVIYSTNCKNETFMVLETLEIAPYDRILGDENCFWAKVLIEDKIGWIKIHKSYIKPAI